MVPISRLFARPRRGGGTSQKVVQYTGYLRQCLSRPLPSRSEWRFKPRDLRQSSCDTPYNKRIFQPASWLEKLLEGLLGSSGEVRAEVSERGLRLLRSCLGVEISIRNPSGANFLEVCLRTPQTSKKSLQKRFHVEACRSPVLYNGSDRNKTAA